VSDIHRLLKPGGYFIIQFSGLTVHWPGCRFGKELADVFLQRVHLILFTRATITDFSASGEIPKVVDFRPFWQDAAARLHPQARKAYFGDFSACCRSWSKASVLRKSRSPNNIGPIVCPRRAGWDDFYSDIGAIVSTWTVSSGAPAWRMPRPIGQC